MTTKDQVIKTVVSGDKALEKIKFGEKFAYFFATMNPNQLLTLISTYLMIFYTDIAGLNPIAVGTLFLIARIMDGISDPIMGYVIDHMPRTKMGKYRYLMIGGAIVVFVNFLLLWFGPVWAYDGKLAVAYITYLVFGFTFDIMDISKNSLLPAMTANSKERSSLGVVLGLATILSGLLVSVVAPLILSAGKSSLGSYSTLILIVGGSVLLFGIVGSLGVKERVIPIEDNTNHSLKDYLIVLTQKPVVAMLGFGLMFSTGYYLFGAVNAYFFTYIMHDLGILSTVSLVQLVGLLPGLFLSGLIVRKLGKKRTVVFTALAMIVAFAIRWIDITSVLLVYISTIAVGFIFGIFVPLSPVITADNVDFIEYKLNYRTEAAQASIGSFIAKVGNGLAGALPGYALGWAGYVAGSQQQPASAINAIIMLSAGIPILFFAIAAMMMQFGYKLDKNILQEVEAKLSERRAAKLNQ